ncbi:cardiolipin synthase ClsB [Nemorincola caseinilytica]|uniref:Cardiolipin synthase ClsB n=1 Tax=Nemorincola caseinilytica TaxID=2054315 RepID=A0ABP8NEU7_9BACT
MARGRKRVREQYTTHNAVHLVRGGAHYFDTLVDIAGRARYSLHFQTYIFDANETGFLVADALMAAAQRGVHVYLMLDGYASQHLPKEFIGKLRQAGVHFRFFEPLLFTYKYYLGRRMHHKILVADAYECLVGGLNVSDRYNDMPDAPAWLDWALHVKGEVAQDLHKICVRMWQRSVWKQKKCLPDSIPLPPMPKEECMVRMSRNDWVYRRIDISVSYRRMFTDARQYATIMTSYFWPPRRLLLRMEAAARRGVKVRVILTGQADVPLAKYAERYLYRRLFRSNIEIYEYQPNVLHAKVAFRDDEWATIGSYNVNNISAFASIEMNLDVYDKDVATQLRDAVKQIVVNDCIQVRKESYEIATNPIRMFLYYLSYRIVHLLFFLFTFYFDQVNRERRGRER